MHTLQESFWVRNGKCMKRNPPKFLLVATGLELVAFITEVVRLDRHGNHVTA
jgi:hypothetical protein